MKMMRMGVTEFLNFLNTLKEYATEHYADAKIFEYYFLSNDVVTMIFNARDLEWLVNNCDKYKALLQEIINKARHLGKHYKLDLILYNDKEDDKETKRKKASLKMALEVDNVWYDLMEVFNAKIDDDTKLEEAGHILSKHFNIKEYYCYDIIDDNEIILAFYYEDEMVIVYLDTTDKRYSIKIADMLTKIRIEHSENYIPVMIE